MKWPVLTVIDGVRAGRYAGRSSARTVRVSRCDGGEVLCHVGSAGSSRLLTGGARVYYRPGRSIGSISQCRVVGVEPPHGPLVVVDAMLSNVLWEKASTLLLGDSVEWVREEWINGIRVDFVGYSGSGDKPLLVEVKSVFNVVNGVALFPASPSRRVLRQIEALYVAAQNVQAKPLLAITVLRDDARVVRFNRRADRILVARLKGFIESGVLSLVAYRVKALYEGEHGRISILYYGPLRVETG